MFALRNLSKRLRSKICAWFKFRFLLSGRFSAIFGLSLSAVIMVDCSAVYPHKDKVPELALRQIFGRACSWPRSGMLSIERMAMLGDTITSVKETLKAIVGDDTKFGADAPDQELSLTLLAAIWKSASTLPEHVSARSAK